MSLVRADTLRSVRPGFSLQLYNIRNVNLCNCELSQQSYVATGLVSTQVEGLSGAATRLMLQAQPGMQVATVYPVLANSHTVSCHCPCKLLQLPHVALWTQRGSSGRLDWHACVVCDVSICF